MKNTNTNEEECVEGCIDMIGSLRTKIVGLVSDDNAKQEGRFDPEDQADRLASDHFDEISEHPEFKHMMVRKAIRHTSGSKAANGAKILTDAYDIETGKIHLVVTDDMTICITDGGNKEYIPLRLAGINDLKNCVERKNEKAEKETFLAMCMEHTVDALVNMMTTQGKHTLGEILDNDEFQL